MTDQEMLDRIIAATASVAGDSESEHIYADRSLWNALSEAGFPKTAEWMKSHASEWWYA